MYANVSYLIAKDLKKLPQQETFKSCPMCGKKWISLHEFLNDQNLKCNGFHPATDIYDFDLYYFTHLVEGCGTTMGMLSGSFFSLYNFEPFEQKVHGMGDCNTCSFSDLKFQRCAITCEHMIHTEIAKVVVDNFKVCRGLHSSG